MPGPAPPGAANDFDYLAYGDDEVEMVLGASAIDERLDILLEETDAFLFEDPGDGSREAEPVKHADLGTLIDLSGCDDVGGYYGDDVPELYIGNYVKAATVSQDGNVLCALPPFRDLPRVGHVSYFPLLAPLNRQRRSGVVYPDIESVSAWLRLT